MRDRRVIFYGEDVADYGGAFKLTKGLLESFGRDRVFNTPISEAAICGTAVGAAIVGLRPVVELMYMDFALMASDQIANQAAKWHYMSGGQVEVPLVMRASVGAGQGLRRPAQPVPREPLHAPPRDLRRLPGSNPADAKGLLKSAIRTNNPVLFVESQGLYPRQGRRARRASTWSRSASRTWCAEGDATSRSSAWGPAVLDALAAADRLHGRATASRRRSSTCAASSRWTSRPSSPRSARPAAASSPARPCSVGSFVNEIVARIQEEAFDYLDAPIGRIGAANGISPQAEGLEQAFLPNAGDIYAAAKALL